MALYKICRGPRFGQTINLPNSQEVGLLLQLGDIEPLGKGTQPEQQQSTLHSVPPQQKRGWAISFLGVDRKPQITFFDGMGGKTFYHQDRVPADCPQAVVEEWRRLRPPSADELEARREREIQARMRLEHQSKSDGDVAAYLAKLGHTEGL